MEAQLISPFDHLFAFLRANIVRNLHSVLFIVHQQHLQICRGLHEKLVKAVLDATAGLLVRSVADIGSEGRALELAANSTIHT